MWSEDIARKEKIQIVISSELSLNISNSLSCKEYKVQEYLSGVSLRRSLISGSESGVQGLRRAAE